MAKKKVETMKPELVPSKIETGAGWEIALGDCIEVLSRMPAASVDYAVYSPPFSSLYTYSDDERDMGNCKSRGEFLRHYRFVVPELYRVLKPGRLISFHCMQLPTSKEKDGYIGIYDFRGKLIAAHENCLNCGKPRMSEDDDSHGCKNYEGMIFHSEVPIWKDPVTAMQRTKAIGLLHKQVRKNRNLSRQGILDYFVTMRKPGECAEPICGLLDAYRGEMSDKEFTSMVRQKYTGPIVEDEDGESTNFDTYKSINIWQRYASPVWMDIDPGDTLQYTHVRTEKDERHICPLQLGVIERGIALWSNPGDVVLSPFAGIGSEGYQAIKMGRRFTGVELKPEYFDWAAKNLRSAVEESKQMPLVAV